MSSTLEFEATTEHVKWDRNVSMEQPDIKRAISGFAGKRRVQVLKIRRTMESAYVAAFQLTEDCKNVAKISFAAGPFGMATICVLSPGLNNVIIFDKYEVNGEDVIKAKDGLCNRRIINWTYKLLGDTKLEFEDYSFHCEQCPYTATSESNLTNHKEFDHQKLRPHKEN